MAFPFSVSLEMMRFSTSLMIGFDWSTEGMMERICVRKREKDYTTEKETWGRLINSGIALDQSQEQFVCPIILQFHHNEEKDHEVGVRKRNVGHARDLLQEIVCRALGDSTHVGHLRQLHVFPKR